MAFVAGNPPWPLSLVTPRDILSGGKCVTCMSMHVHVCVHVHSCGVHRIFQISLRVKYAKRIEGGSVIFICIEQRMGGCLWSCRVVFLAVLFCFLSLSLSLSLCVFRSLSVFVSFSVRACTFFLQLAINTIRQRCEWWLSGHSVVRRRMTGCSTRSWREDRLYNTIQGFPVSSGIWVMYEPLPSYRHPAGVFSTSFSSVSRSRLFS
jgi:hypothetical protein